VKLSSNRINGRLFIGPTNGSQDSGLPRVCPPDDKDSEIGRDSLNLHYAGRSRLKTCCKRDGGVGGEKTCVGECYYAAAQRGDTNQEGTQRAMNCASRLVTIHFRRTACDFTRESPFNPSVQQVPVKRPKTIRSQFDDHECMNA